MSTFVSVSRFLSVAILGIGLGASAWAQTPPSPPPRDIMPNAVPELRSPFDAAAEAAPPSSPASNRLEVPSGSDIKITIEVLSKSNPAPAPAPSAHPVTAEPPEPAVTRKPLPLMESIQPIPLPPIPDNPLPHEGAMFVLEHVVEPPDLITIEVLEALPGRPISGERLVRPDGTISISFYGEIYVRGLTCTQVKEKVILHLRHFIPDEVLGLMEQDENGKWQDLDPKDSNRVFVDVTAYNTKSYYIQGDVAAPGKLPWTGNETVLDAMNYAGGFIPAADPKNIRLVRPGRDGKPSKVYPVDYDAILNRGEIEKNYQLFPGDRLVVGRNALVTTTIELDRIAGAMATVLNSIQKHSAAMASLTQPAPGSDKALTPDQREAVLVKAWADFWWQIASRPAGAELDEKTFREALMKTLNTPPAETPPRGKK